VSAKGTSRGASRALAEAAISPRPCSASSRPRHTPERCGWLQKQGAQESAGLPSEAHRRPDCCSASSVAAA
jgi:hypothetical protein